MFYFGLAEFHTDGNLYVGNTVRQLNPTSWTAAPQDSKYSWQSANSEISDVACVPKVMNAMFSVE